MQQPVKTPPTSRKNPGRSEELIQSLDALNAHMPAVEAVARLMRRCVELSPGAMVDAQTVGNAGFLIGREVGWMRKEARQFGAKFEGLIQAGSR